MKRQRVSKYNTLFLGQPGGDPGLKAKSMRDRTARGFNLSPPMMYHWANHVSSAPKSFHEPVPRHQNPINMPDMRSHSRFTTGSSLYNQALNAQIAQLTRMV